MSLVVTKFQNNPSRNIGFYPLRRSPEYRFDTKSQYKSAYILMQRSVNGNWRWKICFDHWKHCSPMQRYVNMSKESARKHFLGSWLVKIRRVESNVVSKFQHIQRRNLCFDRCEFCLCSSLSYFQSNRRLAGLNKHTILLYSYSLQQAGSVTKVVSYRREILMNINHKWLYGHFNIFSDQSTKNKNLLSPELSLYSTLFST